MPPSRQRGALPKLSFPTLLFATSAALCVVTGVLVASRRPADDGRNAKPRVRATPGPWGVEPTPEPARATPAAGDTASSAGSPGTAALAMANQSPAAATPIPRRAVKGFGDDDDQPVVVVPLRPGVTVPPLALPPGMTPPSASGLASAGGSGQPPVAPPTVPYDPLAPVTPATGPGAMAPSDYSSPYLAPTPYVAPPIPPSGLSPAQMAKRAKDEMFKSAANGTARGSRAVWPELGRAPGTPKPARPYFTPVTNGSYDASASPTPMARGGTLVPSGAGFDPAGGANPFPFPSDATRDIGKPTFRLPPPDAPAMPVPGVSGAPAPSALDGALGPDFGSPPAAGPSLDPLAPSGPDALPISGPPPPDFPPPTPRGGAGGKRGRGDRSQSVTPVPDSTPRSYAAPGPTPGPLKITRPGAAVEFDRAVASAPPDAAPGTVGSALEKLKAAEEADERRRAEAAATPLADSTDPAGPDSAAPGAGSPKRGPAAAAAEATPISYSSPDADAGVAPKARTPPAPGTVARVGDRELPADEARRRGETLGPLLAKTRKPAPTPEPAAAAPPAGPGKSGKKTAAAAKTPKPAEAAARLAAEDWAERAALAAEARRQSMTVSDDEVKAYRARLRATHGGRYEDALRGAGVTGDELTAEMRDGALADKLLEAQVARRYDEAALKDEYEAAPAKYDAGRRVKVLEIVKRGPAGAATAAGRKLEKTAKDLAKQAADAEGDAFAELAREASDAPTRDQGGDRGWMDTAALAALPEETRIAVSRLKPGGTSPPVALPDGYAVYRMEKVEEAGSGYEKAKPRLMEAVKAREAARLTEAALRKGDVYLAHRPQPAGDGAGDGGTPGSAASPKAIARKAPPPAAKPGAGAGDVPEGFESAGPSPSGGGSPAKPASAKAVASPVPTRKSGSGGSSGTAGPGSARADSARRAAKASALPLETTESTQAPADNRSTVRKALASLFGPSPAAAGGNAGSGSDPLAPPPVRLRPPPSDDSAKPAGAGPSGQSGANPRRTPSPDRIPPAPAGSASAGGPPSDSSKTPAPDPGSGSDSAIPTVGRVTVRGGRAAPGSAISPSALSPAQQAAIRASRGGLPGDGPVEGRPTAFGAAKLPGGGGMGASGERPLPESGAVRGPSTAGLPVNASLGKGPVSPTDMMGILNAGSSGGGGNVRPVSARGPGAGGVSANRPAPRTTPASDRADRPDRPDPVPGFGDPAAKPAAGKPGFLTGFFGRPTPASGQ